jgi:hypothetical protein
VDMSETLHRKLSMLAAKTGRKKVDRLCWCYWMGWRKSLRSKDFLHIVRSLYSESGDRFFMLPGLNQ